MTRKLSTSDPYNSLRNDLYSVGIFDPTINGLLSAIEKNDNNQTILVQREFADDSGSHVDAGYYFIQCLNSLCKEKHLKQYRGFLESVVKQKAKGNYMEVDPILIAPEYDNAVLSFVDQYNKLQKRKPIQLFMCGE